MKLHLQIFIAFILFSKIVLAQNSSQLNFYNGTWNNAIIKAKTNNQNIIVFCHRSNGYVESNIENNVFTNPEVVEYFKKNYFFYLVDFNSPEESSYFIDKYHVYFTPTFIFFDTSGNASHQRYFINNPEELIKVASLMYNPDSAYYLLQTEHIKNPLDEEKLYKYAMVRSKTGIFKYVFDDVDTVSQRYFNTQSDSAMLNLRNWTAIKSLVKTIADPLFEFLVVNKENYETLYGKTEVDATVFEIVKEGFLASPMRFQNTQDTLLYTNSRKLLVQMGTSEANEIIKMGDEVYKLVGGK